MSVAHASATRRGPQPRSCGRARRTRSPGSTGTTTWNASAGSPPWARGSDSGPMISRNSTTEPGQPWVTISGSASGSGERAWMKCTRVPSTSVTKLSKALSIASARRQS